MTKTSSAVQTADTVTLDKDEAAIVVRTESVQLVTPERDDNSEVPGNIIFAAAVTWLAVNRPEWVESTVIKFYEETSDE